MQTCNRLYLNLPEVAECARWWCKAWLFQDASNYCKVPWFLVLIQTSLSKKGFTPWACRKRTNLFKKRMSWPSRRKQSVPDSGSANLRFLLWSTIPALVVAGLRSVWRNVRSRTVWAKWRIRTLRSSNGLRLIHCYVSGARNALRKVLWTRFWKGAPGML